MTEKKIDFGVQFDVIDEIKEPAGMKMRLIQSHRTKALAIQSWGYMSGEWITTQRYQDVQGNWDRSKKIATEIVASQKSKKSKKVKSNA
jgi:hypothetical protein